MTSNIIVHNISCVSLNQFQLREEVFQWRFKTILVVISMSHYIMSLNSKWNTFGSKDKFYSYFKALFTPFLGLPKINHLILPRLSYFLAKLYIVLCILQKQKNPLTSSFIDHAERETWYKVIVQIYSTCYVKDSLGYRHSLIYIQQTWNKVNDVWFKGN